MLVSGRAVTQKENGGEVFRAVILTKRPENTLLRLKKEESAYRLSLALQPSLALLERERERERDKRQDSLAATAVEKKGHRHRCDGLTILFSKRGAG